MRGESGGRDSGKLHGSLDKSVIRALHPDHPMEGKLPCEPNQPKLDDSWSRSRRSAWRRRSLRPRWRPGITWTARPAMTTTTGDIQQDGDPNHFSINVVSILSIDGAPAVLDGFTVTKGNASGSAGGGILVVRANAIIRSCVIIDNRAPVGGGLNIIVSATHTVRVRDCLFANNFAVGRGGAARVGSSGLLRTPPPTGDNKQRSAISQSPGKAFPGLSSNTRRASESATTVRAGWVEVAPARTSWSKIRLDALAKRSLSAR